MQIDADRFLANLGALARIGALPGGGVRRLAFSREDRLGRDFVARRLRQAGLEPKVDPIGNLWCVRAGTDPEPAPVFLGSHTDTVGSAGRFDGALGVLAALEVLERLQETGISTHHAVGLLSFVNEEGVRFMPDMIGSLFLRGDLTVDAIRGITGTDGTTIGENLDAHELQGTDDLRGTPIRAFLELHIEQGPVLDEAEEPVGIVTGVQGLKWLEIALVGQANHAGTTPMAGRRDPAVVAAQTTVLIREMTERHPGLRGTVGRIVTEPNLINVIPNATAMTVDLRHPEQEVLDVAVSETVDRIKEIAGREAVEIVIREAASAPAVVFDQKVVEAVAASTASLGLVARKMISGAGHDAQILAGKFPAGMVFVRSRGGVSHSPDEYSSGEDCVAGANVLLGAALQLAG